MKWLAFSFTIFFFRQRYISLPADVLWGSLVIGERKCRLCLADVRGVEMNA